MLRSKIRKQKDDKIQAKYRVKEIAESWKKEPEDVKNFFEACARVSKKRHAERYGTYRYKPKRNNQKRVNNTDGRFKPVQMKTEPNLTESQNLNVILIN